MNETSSLFSTRINELRNNNLQLHAGRQREAGSPHIHDPAGLRFVMANRRNIVNEQQNFLNDRNSVNEHHILVNDYDNRQTPHKINNGVATSQTNVSNIVTTQPELTIGMTNNNDPEKTQDQSNSRENDYPTKSYQSMDHKNDINRLADANGKSTDERQKDTFNIAANLRQFLRPTVIEKREESAKVEYEAEDINGPYNFRQLLRPTRYLPTESLRKRKGGLVSNGVPMPKDKVPEKHVKRRAPLAPTQNKVANGKK